ncbi:uncharacterized protein LOC131856516 [Cryptomeria japonica]|uniref:uncharacterized protein LOC131856516 n=1 Tax=Cryptomeria japonica TaxID=3369 RepID=UPI0027DA4B63|nr:uncharacterized protein LOC131856516 [Cryptomeria japonica]
MSKKRFGGGWEELWWPVAELGGGAAPRGQAERSGGRAWAVGWGAKHRSGVAGRQPGRGVSGGGGGATKAAGGSRAKTGSGETEAGLSVGAGRRQPAGSRGGRRPVEELAAGVGGCRR